EQQRSRCRRKIIHNSSFSEIGYRNMSRRRNTYTCPSRDTRRVRWLLVAIEDLISSARADYAPANSAGRGQPGSPAGEEPSKALKTPQRLEILHQSAPPT